MIDRLREIIGLKSDRRERRAPRREREERPRAPELAPSGVHVFGGQTTLTGAALRVTLVVVGVLLLLVTAYLLQELILVVVVATIVAAAMHQPVAALERRGTARALAIIIAYGGLLAVIAAIVLFIAGPLVAELEDLFENAPQLIGQLRQQVVGLIDGFAGQGTGEEVIGAVEGALGKVELGGLIELPLQAAGVLVNVVIILFLSAFLILERDRAEDWLVPLLEPSRQRPARRLGRAVFGRLGRFVLGQLLIMTIVGLSMFVALLVLGVPFALPLALFAFLAEAIPMIGPWIAIVPAAGVALTESPVQALILIGWWIVVQQLEGYVLTPAVMGRVQHLSATVVLLSVLAGFELLGVVGALIAVPVVAALAMIVESVLRPARRQTLENRPS